MKEDKKVILKVLVGSRAHGLNTPESDYDYRSVYVLPTSKILSIGYKYKGNAWLEGEKEDNTAYEIGHFLHLATKCNPTILEIFRAPIMECTEDGKKLRDLFNFIWEPRLCFDAFTGYGYNQRKKFLDKKDCRQNKYAVAYIRVLFQLFNLLHTGKLIVKIPDKYSQIKETLMRYKIGNYTNGEVIDLAENIATECKYVLKECTQSSNIEKVNKFLLDIRKRNW